MAASHWIIIRVSHWSGPLRYCSWPQIIPSRSVRRKAGDEYGAPVASRPFCEVDVIPSVDKGQNQDYNQDWHGCPGVWNLLVLPQCPQVCPKQTGHSPTLGWHVSLLMAHSYKHREKLAPESLEMDVIPKFLKLMSHKRSCLWTNQQQQHSHYHSALVPSGHGIKVLECSMVPAPQRGCGYAWHWFGAASPKDRPSETVRAPPLCPAGLVCARDEHIEWIAWDALKEETSISTRSSSFWPNITGTLLFYPLGCWSNNSVLLAVSPTSVVSKVSE